MIQDRKPLGIFPAARMSHKDDVLARRLVVAGFKLDRLSVPLVEPQHRERVYVGRCDTGASRSVKRPLHECDIR
jgi:hypothetical protein